MLLLLWLVVSGGCCCCWRLLLRLALVADGSLGPGVPLDIKGSSPSFWGIDLGWGRFGKTGRRSVCLPFAHQLLSQYVFLCDRYHTCVE